MNILNLKGKSVEEIKATLDKYLFEARQARVEEHSSKEAYGSSYGKTCAIPMIEIEGTPYKLSVQASSSHYCSPREDLQYSYEDVEIGFPNFNFSKEFIFLYAEDSVYPQDTVYGYVPMVELVEELYLLLNYKGEV